MTGQWVQNVKPPAAGRVIYWDEKETGLGLRVNHSGSKVWVVWYWVRGQGHKRLVTLGPYGNSPKLSLADARQKAHEMLGRAAMGEDPGARKQEAKAAPTVEELAKDYLERYAIPRKRSWKRDAQVLRADVLPAWGRMKVHDVRRRDVIELLDAIKDRGSPMQANYVLAVVRKMFNWAIGRDVLEHNPCSQVPAPTQPQPRQRVLSEGELRAIWRAAEAQSPLIAVSYKLRMLTAQRGGEVMAMRWADLDLQAGWWTIPPERAKNGLAHRVPLVPAAVTLLEELKAITGYSAWVFPSRSHKDQFMANTAKATERIRELSGVDFVPHDLRRTAASWMASLRIPRLVIGKLLNHVDQDVTGRHYDRYAYDLEKREALEAWAERLVGIVS